MPRSSSTIFTALRPGLHALALALALGLLLLAMPLSGAPAWAQMGQSVTFIDADGEVLADLDRAALEAIGRVEVRTATPWDDDVVSFEGPLLRDLVAAIGFDDAAIAVQALNDYASEIPYADMRDVDVILAVRKDGEYMSVAEMGPAFIVYPYDSDPRLRDRVYYARSVWQVSRILQLPRED